MYTAKHGHCSYFKWRGSAQPAATGSNDEGGCVFACGQRCLYAEGSVQNLGIHFRLSSGLNRWRYICILSVKAHADQRHGTTRINAPMQCNIAGS